jgi:prepilin-type N-terminal cleavage/methylation domain-containing protein
MNPKQTQTQRKRKRGFSLTEFAIVLGVAGIILSGVWALASNINSNAKQEKFSEMLNVIVGNIRGNYVGKTYFDTTLTPTVGAVTGMMPILTSLNVFPGDAVHVSGGVSVVDSPFGEQSTTGLPAAGTPYNSLYVCGWKATGSTGCAFTAATSTASVPLFAIEALLPSGNACIGAALRNSNPTALPGLVDVYINGTGRVSHVPALTLPWDLASAKTACNLAVNTVDFVFRLTP